MGGGIYSKPSIGTKKGVSGLRTIGPQLEAYMCAWHANSPMSQTNSTIAYHIISFIHILHRHKGVLAGRGQ